MADHPALSPPDPPLCTDRILLRPFRLSDAGAVALSCQDPDIGRFTLMPDDLTEDQAAWWIEASLKAWPKGTARLAITLPPGDTAVGQVGVAFEFAVKRATAFYWLDGSVRGRGIASEALELVARWVFERHDVVRLQLVTDTDNEASQGVATRCGFVREGVLRAWEPVKGAQPDMVMWSRLNTDRP